MGIADLLDPTGVGRQVHRDLNRTLVHKFNDVVTNTIVFAAFVMLVVNERHRQQQRP